MVDSGRHFLPVDALRAALDGMAASGLNVFHWHLTDAQSWPWDPPSRPRLVEGAYRPDMVYSREDLQDIANYAADRAIEVIPEIDMPGHAGSIALGYPEVVVACEAV